MGNRNSSIKNNDNIPRNIPRNIHGIMYKDMYDDMNTSDLETKLNSTNKIKLGNPQILKPNNYTSTPGICIKNNKIKSTVDKTLRIWDCNTGIYHELCDTNSNLANILYLKNNIYCFGSKYYTICIYNLDNNELLQELKGHTHIIHSIYVINDGDMIISCSSDTTIRIWEMRNKSRYTCSKILRGHTDNVYSICITNHPSNPSNIIISGSTDKTIRIWSTHKHHFGKCLQILTGHTKSIVAVAVINNPINNNKLVISSSMDNTVRFWDVDIINNTSECIKILRFQPAINKLLLTSQINHVISIYLLNNSIIYTFSNSPIYTNQINLFPGEYNLYQILLSNYMLPPNLVDAIYTYFDA